MNKAEQNLLEILTGNAWKHQRSTVIGHHEKRMANAVRSLMKTKIIIVTEHDLHMGPYYQVSLNLPAYVCEDCEGKYNDAS